MENGGTPMKRIDPVELFIYAATFAIVIIAWHTIFG